LLPLFRILEEKLWKDIGRIVLDNPDSVFEMVSFDIGVSKRNGTVVNIYRIKHLSVGTTCFFNLTKDWRVVY
jgi:hypothetical protein